MKAIDKSVKKEILEKCKNNPELKKEMALEYSISVSTINEWIRKAEEDEKSMLTVSEEIKLTDEEIHSLIKFVKKEVIKNQKNPDNYSPANDDGEKYLTDEAQAKDNNLYYYLGLRLVYDIKKEQLNIK
jgi:transposase-like protein